MIRTQNEYQNKAILIGVKTIKDEMEEIEESLRELVELVRTAGGDVVGSYIRKQSRYEPRLVVGKGFLERIKEEIEQKKIDLVVFDVELKPAQVRNIEDLLKVRVITRTDVILDIFAQRARTSEAKAQVELAQLKFLLPRIIGYGKAMSRLGGGIGTRGPGEKELEYDRRHIQRRITTLQRKLEKIEKHRNIIRKRRKKEIVGAVVGYTNAGKSTLINTLAKTNLFVEDRLFATLDSYSREVYLGNGKKIILTDTVGFIRRIPTFLISAFRSTLQEVVEANFLIHLIDASSQDIHKKIGTVEKILKELNSYEKPTIMVFNKIDLIDEERLHFLENEFFEYSPIFISLAKNINLHKLQERLVEVCESIVKK